MIKSTGFIPLNPQNQISGSKDAHINIYQVNSAKGKLPSFVLQCGNWTGPIAAVLDEEQKEISPAKPGFFTPADHNIWLTLDEQRQTTEVEYDPADLPTATSGANPTEQLINQIELYAIPLLEASYPLVNFSKI